MIDFSYCEWDKPILMIFSQNVFDKLIYYSHLTPLLLSLLIGVIIYTAERKNLINKILFAITLMFSAWVFFDLILWATDDPRQTMFFWPIVNLIEPVIYVASVYFIYVFVTKNPPSRRIQGILLLLLLPIIALTPTKLALQGFDFTNCDREAIEGPLVYYGYLVEFISALWILFYGFISAKVSSNVIQKKQIILVTVGLVLFLLAFGFGNIIGSLSVDWTVAQYGLFGMPIFIGFLAYLIAKYNALNTKTLTAQITVYVTFILIVSLLFITDLNSVHFVVAVTLVIMYILGRILINSVKKEVEQKEMLEKMTDQLELANLKLQDLDKMKTEFLSLASHQLRSPLTAIKGYASMLLEGSYGQIVPEQKVPVDRIFQSSVNLAQIVEDLLDVSKMEQGGMKFEMADVDLVGILKGLTNELQVSAKSRNLDLVFETNLTEAIVEVDSVKIRQVFANYVDNALKYTEKGTVKISIAKSDDGKKIVVGVKDSGMGIPPEIMKTLFKKFERGEGGKVNAGGSGLGLYLAKEIVSAHKGRTWAESEGRGKGSTFFVELSLK